jgi:DNA-binding transcriptional ArsR family regulator
MWIAGTMRLSLDTCMAHLLQFVVCLFDQASMEEVPTFNGHKAMSAGFKCLRFNAQFICKGEEMALKVHQRTIIEKRQEALAHPLRREVLRLLVEKGCASPVEMAREIEEPTPNVSHHTKRLVELGFAEQVEERKVRGAVEHLYRAIDRPLVETDEWEELVEKNPQLATHLTGEFMQAILNAFVSSAKAGMVGSDKNFHLSCTPLILDAQGMADGMAHQERCRLELLEVQRESAERRSRTGGAAVHVSSCQGFFKVPAPVDRD